MIKKCLLVLVSSVIALSVCEFIAGGLLKIPSFSRFHQRFTVDGNPAFLMTLLTDDPHMPFRVKSNFSHMISDQGYRPTAHRITTDHLGYRNASTPRDSYHATIVGDSVTFGIGVDDEQTIAAHVARLTGSPTYNLGIPGAGPGMYMAMIDRFLMQHTTNHLAVLVFDGNDFVNLNNASWRADDQCGYKPNLEVRRSDISSQPAQPDAYVFAPYIRNSSLFYLGYQVLVANKPVNFFKWGKLGPDDQQKIASQKASSRTEAQRHLKHLIAAACLAQSHKDQIASISQLLSNAQDDAALKKMGTLVQELYVNDCVPIGPDMTNLATKAHLAMFSSATAEQKLLHDRYFADLSAGEVIDPFPKRCEETKVDTFLAYLQSVKEQRGVDVQVFVLPSESHLKLYSQRLGQVHHLCRKAREQTSVPCTSFIEPMVFHYQQPQHNALYIDGSHLSEEGNKVVAGWISDVLQSMNRSSSTVSDDIHL